MADLKRQLGLLDSTMIQRGDDHRVRDLIVPSVIALNLGASVPTILVWVVGGVVHCWALSLQPSGRSHANAGGSTCT